MPALLLALALAGCGGGSSALQTFELAAPQEFGNLRQARGTLSVALPTALQALDSERVVVQPAAGEINYLPGARWSDRLPRIVQARIIEAFEKGKRIRAVVRVGDRLKTDYQLDTELREFGVLVGAPNQAIVELSVRIVNERTGQVVAAQSFTGRAETEAVDGPSATAAINTAFGTVLIEMVRWVTARI